MKKLLKCMFFLFACLMFSFNIKALTCDDAKRDSKKVEAYYQIVNEEKKVYLIIAVENINDSIYVNVENSEKDILKKYSYDVEVTSFVFTDITNYKTFLFKIYSNTSDCKDTLLNTITLKTPIYNTNYESEICNNNPNFSYCVPFIGISVKNKDYTQNRIIASESNESLQISDEDFLLAYEKYKTEQEKLELNIFYKIWIQIKNYYLYALIPMVIVSIIYAIVIIVAKKKRSK